MRKILQTLLLLVVIFTSLETSCNCSKEIFSSLIVSRPTRSIYFIGHHPRRLVPNEEFQKFEILSQIMHQSYWRHPIPWLYSLYQLTNQISHSLLSFSFRCLSILMEVTCIWFEQFYFKMWVEAIGILLVLSSFMVSSIFSTL